MPLSPGWRAFQRCTAGLNQATFHCQTNGRKSQEVSGWTYRLSHRASALCLFFKELKLLQALMFLNGQGFSSSWEKVATFPVHLTSEGTFSAWWEHAESYPYMSILYRKVQFSTKWNSLGSLSPNTGSSCSLPFGNFPIRSPPPSFSHPLIKNQTATSNRLIWSSRET